MVMMIINQSYMQNNLAECTATTDISLSWNNYYKCQVNHLLAFNACGL